MSETWAQARLDHRAQQTHAIAASALRLLLEHGAPALTMAAIASEAGVSRQTLYRYYPDVDAVLVGVAELLAAHDEAFAGAVGAQVDPADQLDLIVRSVAEAGDEHGPSATELRSALPPIAREVLSGHEARIHQLLADVLETGIDAGRFRRDLAPSTDAPLLLGLAAAAGTEGVDRALTLVHRLVDRSPKEHPT